jgi:hypothetical protein
MFGAIFTLKITSTHTLSHRINQRADLYDQLQALKALHAGKSSILLCLMIKSLLGFHTSGCSCQILSCSSLLFGHVRKDAPTSRLDQNKIWLRSLQKRNPNKL